MTTTMLPEIHNTALDERLLRRDGLRGFSVTGHQDLATVKVYTLAEGANPVFKADGLGQAFANIAVQFGEPLDDKQYEIFSHAWGNLNRWMLGGNRVIVRATGPLTGSVFPLVELLPRVVQFDTPDAMHFLPAIRARAPLASEALTCLNGENIGARVQQYFRTNQQIELDYRTRTRTR